ncbi:MAG: O-antigen ligase family protein [Kiritimatiellia bacterium]
MKFPHQSQRLVFLIPVVLVTALAVLAAGVIPFALSAVSAAVCLGWLTVLKTVPRNRVILFFFAGVAFVFLTYLPMPAFVHRANPRRAVQNRTAAGAVERAADLGIANPVDRHFSLSRDRAGTGRALLLLITVLGTLALTSAMRNTWKKKFLKFLIVIGTVLAAAGFTTQWLLPQGKYVWWLIPVEHGEPAGCFINRNHFGGFVALLCPAALVLFARGLSRRNAREILWPGTAFAVMSLAVFASLSRGAWIAYAAAVIATLTLSARGSRLLRTAGAALLAAFTLLGVLIAGPREIEERAASLHEPVRTPSARMRIATWRNSLEIVPDFPIAGVGAGAFRAVFPQYRTAATRQSYTFAENDYIQTMVEGGALGTFLSIAVLWFFLRGWRRRVRSGDLDADISLSVAGALIAACVHSMFDFPARVPLYAVVLASMAGLVIEDGAPGSTEPPARGAVSWAAIPIAALICVASISVSGKSVYTLDDPVYLTSADTTALCRSLIWSPAYWVPWYHLGRSAMASDGNPAHEFGEECISRAAYYDPNNYRLWRELARVRLGIGDTAGALEAYRRTRELREWVRVPELERLASGSKLDSRPLRR